MADVWSGVADEEDGVELVPAADKFNDGLLRCFLCVFGVGPIGPADSSKIFNFNTIFTIFSII